MSSKITCECGVPFLIMNNKVGDVVTCTHCGAEMTIGEHNKVKINNNSKQTNKQTNEDDGFEQVEISQIMDALHEEKKIALQKIKSQNELHRNSKKTSLNKNIKRQNAEIVRTGLLSKKIKCLQCGELSDLKVLVCFNCGANPRTGKTYVPLPKEKKYKKPLPIAKIFVALFLVCTVLAFFLAILLLLPKIKALI